MSIKSELRKIWQEDKNFNKQRIKEVAKQIGSTPKTVESYLLDFKREDVKVKVKKPKSGGGLTKFKELFDDSHIIPQKIEEGIQKHLVNSKGEPDWMYDRDFREACGVSVNKWRRYADEYKHLQVRKDSLVIWGHPDIIEDMRLILQR